MSFIYTDAPLCGGWIEVAPDDTSVGKNWCNCGVAKSELIYNALVSGQHVPAEDLT